MPIPGPPLPVDDVNVIPAGSPFWLRVNGTWVHAEGVVPTVQASAERPRSTVTSMNGNRFEQRVAVARRTWSWTLPHAAAAHVATIRAAVDSPADVWLMSDAVAVGNMLPPAACFGPLATIDCGGVPLGSFADLATVTGRVRAGVPTTVSAWSTAGVGQDIADITYPGGTTVLDATAGAGQCSVTFVPVDDGDVTIQILAGAWSAAGLMLTEGTPPATFVAGEAMPCKVVIDDVDDILTMHHSGAWRHTYTATLREVG